MLSHHAGVRDIDDENRVMSPSHLRIRQLLEASAGESNQYDRILLIHTHAVGRFYQCLNGIFGKFIFI